MFKAIFALSQVLFLSSFIAAISFAETNEDAIFRNQIVKPYSIKVSLEPVALLGGDLKIIYDGTLTPKPEKYSGTCIGIEADIGWIYVGGDFFGLYYANGYHMDPLKVFNLNVLKAGVNGKINLVNVLGTGNLNMFGKAGISYCFFNLEQDYINLFHSDIPIYTSIASGIGCFGGGGFEIETSGVTFGIGVFVDYLMPKFAEASQSHNMLILRVPIYVGYSF